VGLKFFFGIFPKKLFILKILFTKISPLKKNGRAKKTDFE
jgi:hypothetical protein